MIAVLVLFLSGFLWGGFLAPLDHPALFAVVGIINLFGLVYLIRRDGFLEWIERLL